MADARGDDDVRPLVRARAGLAGEDRDGRPARRLGAARRGGHHLAAPAADDGRAALGEQTSDLLGAGLVLLAVGLLMMRGLDAGSDWEDALPGLLVSGAGVGLISPALAAAMVSVLPLEQSGLASGINNTFRQTGIAAGIAGLGAIFQRHDPDAAGFAAGLNDVFLVAAGMAALGAVAALLLIRVRA